TSGTISMAGRKRAHISAVSSNASGSRAIPARISVSSSSVIVASCRSAFLRASGLLLSKTFDISSPIAILSLPQTDQPDRFASPSVNKDMQSRANESDRDLSQFAIILAIIDKDVSAVPIKVFGCREVDIVNKKIGRSLRFVPLVLWFGLHVSPNSEPRHSSQVDCSYDLPLETRS